MKRLPTCTGCKYDCTFTDDEAQEVDYVCPRKDG